MSTLGGGLFIGNLNDTHGRYRLKPPLYEKFIEETNVYIT